jgi:hypothetical protein
MDPLKVWILQTFRKAKAKINGNELHLTKPPNPINLLDQKVPSMSVSVKDPYI